MFTFGCYDMNIKKVYAMGGIGWLVDGKLLYLCRHTNSYELSMECKHIGSFKTLHLLEKYLKERYGIENDERLDVFRNG